VIRNAALVLVLVATVSQAAEWEQTLASTSSLLTGGARLVSSDVLERDHGESALITYWESDQIGPNRNIYRCVDIVGADFTPLRQTCWKVLTPELRQSTESD